MQPRDVTTVGEMRRDMTERMRNHPDFGTASDAMLMSILSMWGDDDRVLTNEDVDRWSANLIETMERHDLDRAERREKKRKDAARRAHLSALVQRISRNEGAIRRRGTCGHDTLTATGGRIVCRGCTTDAEWAYVEALMALKRSREAKA